MSDWRMKDQEGRSATGKKTRGIIPLSRWPKTGSFGFWDHSSFLVVSIVATMMTQNCPCLPMSPVLLRCSGRVAPAPGSQRRVNDHGFGYMRGFTAPHVKSNGAANSYSIRKQSLGFHAGPLLLKGVVKAVAGTDAINPQPIDAITENVLCCVNTAKNTRSFNAGPSASILSLSETSKLPTMPLLRLQCHFPTVFKPQPLTSRKRRQAPTTRIKIIKISPGNVRRDRASEAFGFPVWPSVPHARHSKQNTRWGGRRKRETAGSATAAVDSHA